MSAGALGTAGTGRPGAPRADRRPSRAAGPPTPELWAAADAYGRLMGRWSRRVAGPFLDTLPVAAGRRWLDVGCGVGDLGAAVAARCTPSAVVGVDPSVEMVRQAAARTPPGAPVAFQLASAEALPFRRATFDATVSGLALNFAP